MKHSDMKMKANWARTRKKFGTESTEIVVNKTANKAIIESTKSSTNSSQRSGIAWEID